MKHSILQLIAFLLFKTPCYFSEFDPDAWSVNILFLVRGYSIRSSFNFASVKNWTAFFDVHDWHKSLENAWHVQWSVLRIVVTKLLATEYMYSAVQKKWDLNKSDEISKVSKKSSNYANASARLTVRLDWC